MLRLDANRSVSFCDGLTRRDFLHAGAVAVLLLQALLTYSCIRLAATTKNEEKEEATPVVLPPSGLKYAIFLLVVLPILADLHNQFVLAS